MDYELIVIGASWGGLQAVGQVLADAGDDLPATIVVQHRDPTGSDGLASLLQERTRLELRDAEDKDELTPGTIYLAPLDYHLLVESGGTLSLSTEERVHYARPSIDVLFESAAYAYRDRCIGIVLTGANEDGAAGLKRIKELGGVAIVQDPKTSMRSEMPAAALAASNADVVLPLDEIGKFLRGLVLETRVRT